VGKVTNSGNFSRSKNKLKWRNYIMRKKVIKYFLTAFGWISFFTGLLAVDDLYLKASLLGIARILP